MIRGWSVKNTINPPGQVKPKDHVEDQILKDYLARKYPDGMEKLKFHEWYQNNVQEMDKYAALGRLALTAWVWKQAQENK